MSWQLFLIISIFAGAGETLLQRVLVKEQKSDPIAYSILFQLLGGIFISFFDIIRGVTIPNLMPVFLNVLLTVILFGIANIFIFKSLKEIEASKFAIFFATRALWTIIAAIIFLQEMFSAKQIVGTLFIFASVVFVSWKSQRFTLGKGDIFGLLAAATFGLGLTNVSYIVRTVDVFSFLPVIFILPALVVWLFFPSSTKHMKSLLEKKMLFSMCALSFLAAVSAVTYFLAYQVGRNAAQIASINQIITIITVVLAVVILNEKSQTARKIIAAIISVIGVLLVM